MRAHVFMLGSGILKSKGDNIRKLIVCGCGIRSTHARHHNHTHVFFKFKITAAIHARGLYFYTLPRSKIDYAQMRIDVALAHTNERRFIVKYKLLARVLQNRR